VKERDRVFVDANELFPFSVMDLVLSLAEDLLIDFVWADELIDEWERVIVREGKRTPETARAVSDAVRHFFVTTRIDPATYRHRVDDVPGRDVDDRVHTAGCAFGGATVLLTRNRRDFPHDFLAEHGLTVSSADDYLTGLLRRRPSAADHPRSSVSSGVWPPRSNGRPCRPANSLPASVEAARCGCRLAFSVGSDVTDKDAPVEPAAGLRWSPAPLTRLSRDTGLRLLAHEALGTTSQQFRP